LHHGASDAPGVAYVLGCEKCLLSAMKSFAEEVEMVVCIGSNDKAIHDSAVVVDRPGCGERLSERPQGGKRVGEHLHTADQAQASGQGSVVPQLSTQADKRLSMAEGGRVIGIHGKTGRQPIELSSLGWGEVVP
jgi:hypothetical protein